MTCARLFMCARIGARRIWTACANGPAHTCLVLEDDARFEQRELSLLVALFAGVFHSSAGDVDGGMRNAGAICNCVQSLLCVFSRDMLLASCV